MFVIAPPPQPAPLLRSMFKNTKVVESITYDGTIGTPQSVVVRFKNGDRYTYKNVPLDLVLDLLKDNNPEAFFEQHFKKLEKVIS